MSQMMLRFKCAKGHEWYSAVGRFWCEMPSCRECDSKRTVPAISWKIEEVKVNELGEVVPVTPREGSGQ